MLQTHTQKCCESQYSPFLIIYTRGKPERDDLKGISVSIKEFLIKTDIPFGFQHSLTFLSMESKEDIPVKVIFRMSFRL